MRRPTSWIAILAGLAAAGFFLLCGLVMLDGRRDAEYIADQAAANMVQTINGEIGRTFETFDLSLQGAIYAMNEPEFARLTGKPRQLALFDYAANAPYLNAILVLDETGQIVDDSHSIAPPKLNLSRRKYFQIHKHNPDVGMYLSDPFASRLQRGEWSIAISRRIAKPNGSFGGVVVGTVNLNYFQSLFTNLHLRPEDLITVFRTDGTLVARTPFQLAEIGSNHRTSVLFQHYRVAPTGVFNSTATMDGIARRFTFGQVANLPLVVSLGFGITDIYALWRQKALFIGALMTGFVIIILALTVVLVRELARRRRADENLRESESRYRLLAENSSDAIVLRTPDGRRKYATNAFYEIIGRTAEEMRSKHLVDFLEGEFRERRHETLMRLHAGEQRVVELLHYSRPDGTLIWLETVSGAILDGSGAIVEIVTNVRDVSHRKAAEDQLTAAATTDGMTGLANRRSFDERLSAEWKRARRSRSIIALLMIDVDCFKAYNDQFGHQQGDEALKLVATCIASTIRRSSDACARYGGEEFAVILPETDANGAFCIAEQIRIAVWERAVLHPNSPIGRVTISIGMATTQPRPDDQASGLICTADAALYRAKQNGRNRVEMSMHQTHQKMTLA